MPCAIQSIMSIMSIMSIYTAPSLCIAQCALPAQKKSHASLNFQSTWLSVKKYKSYKSYKSYTVLFIFVRSCTDKRAERPAV